MKSQILSTTFTGALAPTISQALQMIAVCLLAGAMLYGAGFSHTPAAHNAAHDMRHSQGFACH